MIVKAQPEVHDQENWLFSVWGNMLKPGIFNSDESIQRLKQEFINIGKGYPITACEWDDRATTHQIIAHYFKNREGLLYYKAYVEAKDVANNPSKYHFVSPIFRNRGTLDWIIFQISEVDNLNNESFAGLGCTIAKSCGGGGTALPHIFLVEYVNNGL